MRGKLMIVALTLGAAAAEAHGGHGERLKVFVRDDTIHIETQIDAQRLAEFDSDRDGALSRREFDAQREAIGHWIDARLSLICKSGERLTPVFADEPVEGHGSLEPDDSVRQLRVVRRYRSDSERRPHAIAFALFDDEGAPKPYVVWTNGGVAEGVLNLQSPMLLLR